jgi:hypothetical protein
VPFAFSAQKLPTMAPGELLVDDRRNNPVRGRKTEFRLLQANALAYTFVDGIPGFSTPGINSLPFEEVVTRPTANIRDEGRARFGGDFRATGNQTAKVDGDVFETVVGAIHWNAAAIWNQRMRGGDWKPPVRYPRPSTAPDTRRQVVALALPRGYDWVRLLTPEARQVIQDLRDKIALDGLGLPTSTPDLLIVDLPQAMEGMTEFTTLLPDLGHGSQRRLKVAHQAFEGHVKPDGFVLAMAVKKSLRSDRLYQPLYEANIMQLLLEGQLNAPRVEFEVHTLADAGTAAKTTYGAASLAAIATGAAVRHRAVRELYKPANATEVVKRFLAFLDARTTLVPPPTN